MEIKPVFTIETYTAPKGIACYYFDLMSDLSFSAFKDEHLLINSKNPNDCIKELKTRGCVCSENYNYLHLN